MKRGSEKEAKDKSTIAALRRRLFILAAYVVVTAALLIYVSYSNYRLLRTATVQFPEATFMAATLTLTPNTADGKNEVYAANMDAVLANLAPGDNVTDLADAEDIDHRIVLTVKSFASEEPDEPEEPENGEEGGEEEPEHTVTPLAMDYVIKVKSFGHLPLDLMLVEEDGTSYKSQRTGSYGAYEYRFYSDSSFSEEAEFHFDKDTEAEKTFYIYVGWLQSPRKPSGWNDGHQTFSTSVNTNENGRYRREVDDLTVIAEITGANPGVDEYDEAPEALPGIPLPDEEPVALAGLSMAPSSPDGDLPPEPEILPEPEPEQTPEQESGE